MLELFRKLIILAVAVILLLFGANLKSLNAQAEEPEKDSTGKIVVQSFQINGNTVIEPETLEKLLEPFKGREIAMDELNSAADLITMAYQEKGYVLARAYIPKQEVKEGVVQISIVEGTLGNIEVVGNKYYHERVLKRYFIAQQKHGVIKEDLLERALMMANDLPKVQTRTVLKRGAVPGTTDLELHSKDSFPVKLSTDYNNFGSSKISRHRYGVSFEITDPRWGYTFSFRGISGRKDDSLLGRAGLSIPANDYGTKVNLSYMKSNYAVGRDLTDLSLEGDTEVYGGEISHPLIKERNRNLTVALGYDHKYTINYILDTERSIDKLSVFYATLNFDNLDRFLGRNIVFLGYYQGVNNFYAIGQDDPQSSRQAADGAFSKYTLNVARIQNIYGYTNFMVRGSAQLSPDRLLAMEQTVLGGYGTVRGHDPSLYLGDSGYLVSGELMFAPPFIANKGFMGQRVGQTFQFALFLDHGAVYYTDPDPGIDKDEYLSGGGGGVRVFYKDILTLKLDAGIPMDNIKFQTEHTLYYFVTSINFF